MESLQSKVQKGLSSVQKGIEGGKSKLQVSQEIATLKREVNESEEKRSNLIYSLGELTYENIRTRKNDSERVKNISDEILELDKNIFDLLKVIDRKTKEENGLTCTCGNSLTSDDKFCKECGKKVESELDKKNSEKIICSRCQSEILASSKYCNCCGININ